MKLKNVAGHDILYDEGITVDVKIRLPFLTRLIVLLTGRVRVKLHLYMKGENCSIIGYEALYIPEKINL